MKRDLNLFIEDILDSINLIENFIGNVSEEDFSENIQLQDAVVRRIEIMGEAVKNIPKNFRDKYPEVEWKKIAGMRDVVIHSYFKIDLNAVWKITKNDLSVLRKQIQKVKDSL